MKECSESEPSCINSDAKSTNLNDNHSKTDDSKMMVAMLEYMKSNQTFQEQIIELLRNPKPNVNNTVIQGDFINNQTFNLNVFLNEKCKDAMNMSDFVNSIELSREDMENVGRNGYVNGISRIFIDNLKNTDVHKRPIHCSDRKREVLYVKEHDKWEREGVDSDNLIKAVRTVEQKNIRMINEWAKQHPECEKSETRANDMYMKLSKHGYDGEDENIIKVVKNIAKETVIERKIMIE
jgi:predicted XRE-type DNA-binding protein